MSASTSFRSFRSFRSFCSFRSFRHCAIPATFAALVALVGCTTMGIPDGMTGACESGTLLLTKGYRPAQPVDFLAYRTESTEPRAATAAAFPREGDSGAPSPTPIKFEAAWTASYTADVVGTACSRATDKPACEKKLAAIRLLGTTCDGLPIVPKAAPAGAPQKLQGVCAMTYLVYTRGDEVGTVTTTAEAKAFFGEIDSPQEAMFVAQLGGEIFSCDEPSPAAFTAVEDGFELLAGSRCERRFVRVSRAGVVTLVRTETGC